MLDDAHALSRQDGLVYLQGGGVDGSDADICRNLVSNCKGGPDKQGKFVLQDWLVCATACWGPFATAQQPRARSHASLSAKIGGHQIYFPL